MKLKSFLGLFSGVLAMALLGCEPRPVVEEPQQHDSAVDVDVQREPDATNATEQDPSGVDVQVGGGEGVQVDVQDADGNQQ